MKAIILSTALAFAVAAPAFANDQLARSVGVEPGVFSTSELARIAGLLETGDSTDRRTAEEIIRTAADGAVSSRSAVSTGSAQLAGSLGLDAGAFTTAELARIAGLLETGDRTDRLAAEDLAQSLAGDRISSKGGVSVGKAQLAANLGLDAEGFTTAELARVAGLLETGDSVDARTAAEILRR